MEFGLSKLCSSAVWRQPTKGLVLNFYYFDPSSSQHQSSQRTPWNLVVLKSQSLVVLLLRVRCGLAGCSAHRPRKVSGLQAGRNYRPLKIPPSWMSPVIVSRERQHGLSMGFSLQPEATWVPRSLKSGCSMARPDPKWQGWQSHPSLQKKITEMALYPLSTLL